MINCASNEARTELKPGVTVTQKDNVYTFVAIAKSDIHINQPMKRERASCAAAKLMATKKIRETFPDIENILLLVEMKETRNFKKGQFCRVEYFYKNEVDSKQK